MKNKLICLTAILILLSLSLCSCITDIFGDAGITMPPQTTKAPSEGTTPGAEDTESQDSEPVYGSKPSYSGLKLSDYIKVDYKGLTLTVDALPPEVTDRAVDANISGLIDYYVTNYGFDCKYTLITEGVVEEWDYAEIGFVGKINGEVFQGGSSSSNVGMIVNEHDSGYIPGFAAGIIGAKYGETVSVPVTFPEDYDATQLAGKEAVFEITVYGKRVFDITDSTIDALTGGEHKTLSDFREYYKGYLSDLYESNLLNEVSSQILEVLADNCTVYSYPNDQFLYYYRSNVNNMTLQAKKLGMSYEEYMEATGETEEVLREIAQESVREDMLIYYVLESEGKTYSDDEYNKALDYYVNYYNSLGYSYDRATIEKAFEMNYYPGYLRYQFNLERVISIVFEAANIVEG